MKKKFGFLVWFIAICLLAVYITICELEVIRIFEVKSIAIYFAIILFSYFMIYFRLSLKNRNSFKAVQNLEEEDFEISQEAKDKLLARGKEMAKSFSGGKNENVSDGISGDAYIAKFSGVKLYSWDGKSLSIYAGKKILNFDGKNISKFAGANKFSWDGKKLSKFAGAPLYSFDGKSVSEFAGAKSFVIDNGCVSEFAGKKVFSYSGNVPVPILIIIASGLIDEFKS